MRMQVIGTGPSAIRGWLLLVVIFGCAYLVRYLWQDTPWSLVAMVLLLALGVWMAPPWRSHRRRGDSNSAG